MSAPLTGIHASNGKDLETGVRFAFGEANAQHVKLGGSDVHFELDSVDDQSDPRICVQVAQKLVDDGIVGVVGYYNSGVALPSAPIFAKAGISLIDPAATNPAITGLGGKNVFRIVATDAQNSGNTCEYMVTVTKAKRIAIMGERTAFGQEQSTSSRGLYGQRAVKSSRLNLRTTRPSNSMHSSPISKVRTPIYFFMAAATTRWRSSPSA